jgi:putative sterol carrier protein
VGPKLRAANVVMKVVYQDPDCEMTVRFADPIETIFGPAPGEPDITLSMPADIADRFWRGKYNLAVGLARSEVKAKGPVNKILKLVPLTKPLFPVYRDLIAQKDEEG